MIHIDDTFLLQWEAIPWRFCDDERSPNKMDTIGLHLLIDISFEMDWIEFPWSLWSPENLVIDTNGRFRHDDIWWSLMIYDIQSKSKQHMEIRGKSVGNPCASWCFEVPIAPLRCPSSRCCGSFQGSRWNASWACWTPRPIWSWPGVSTRFNTFQHFQKFNTFQRQFWDGLEPEKRPSDKDLGSPVDNGSWPLDAERLS